MTPEQKTAVANILKGDLKTLSHQQLIELCILYEAAPDAHDIFPAALKTELERRFTATEIAKNDTLYAVLQKKANTYQSAIPLFHQRLLEMAGTVNRDIWFTDNKALFESAIADADVARWLVKQHDILEKCLRNRLALAMLAASATASSAILTDQNSLALWKNTPDLWDIWPQHREGMTVLAKSAELVQYVIDTAAALAAVVASDNAMQPLIASATARRVWVDSEVAMTAVAASQTAMTAVAASQTAMTAVAASQTAMTAVAASQTAMTAVASVTAALKTVLKTNDFRTALMASNTVFQAARAAAYQTVSASGSGWVKQRSLAHYQVNQLNPTVAAPLGFVFACLGYYNKPAGPGSIMTHPGGGEAARAASTRTPTTMASVDGISFNGATFTETGDGYAYVELWAPA
ncbi:hypothetical protein [Cardiobacterium hominis]